MLITVTVPHDRTQLGTLKVDEFECRCFCKSDTAAAVAAGNPTRDPKKKDGDMPCGAYTATVGEVEQPEHSYGPHPVIRLMPIEGDALIRAKNEGLKPGKLGLLLHSGPLNAQGKLRPTHGCIRVDEPDHGELVKRMLMWGRTARLELTESD